MPIATLPPVERPFEDLSGRSCTGLVDSVGLEVGFVMTLLELITVVAGVIAAV